MAKALLMLRAEVKKSRFVSLLVVMLLVGCGGSSSDPPTPMVTTPVASAGVFRLVFNSTTLPAGIDTLRFTFFGPQGETLLGPRDQLLGGGPPPTPGPPPGPPPGPGGGPPGGGGGPPGGGGGPPGGGGGPPGGGGGPPGGGGGPPGGGGGPPGPRVLTQNPPNPLPPPLLTFNDVPLLSVSVQIDFMTAGQVVFRSVESLVFLPRGGNQVADVVDPTLLTP